MKKPNSKRNLDMAIRRMGDGNADYLRNRSIIANAIVGQMLAGAVAKGGSSLKIRFGDLGTRATTDLDAARVGEAAVFAEGFARRLAGGWEGFTAKLIEKPKAHPKNVPEVYVMQPYEVKLSYLGSPWCTVAFELGHNELGDADEAELVEAHDAVRLLAAMGFPAPASIPLMPLHHQIAQKIHGASEPNSQRAHDLVDLQLIAGKAEVDYALVRQTCERLFAYRQAHSWPPVVKANESWDSIYSEAAEGLDVLPGVDEAVVWANRFVARIAAAE